MNALRWWDKKITDIELPTLQTINPSNTCEKTVLLMKKLGVDQISVVDGNNG